MRTLNLISLYYYVCQLYDEELHAHCFRHTKNGVEPSFTDQEVITLFLFLTFTYRPRYMKDMHKIAQDAYLDWFPDLPCYERFVKRINRISSVLGLIVNDLCKVRLKQIIGKDKLCDEHWLLTDSFPIVSCAGNRKGVVAPELTDRGYNSTKRMHFWGVKVHVIAYKTRGHLPVPVQLWVSQASEHDYRAQVKELEDMSMFNLSGDKAFESRELITAFERDGGAWMVGKKDNYRTNQEKRKRHMAADKMYNHAVSKLKQPIEALFATFWRMGVQLASAVRSTAGLTRHITGNTAAAMPGRVLVD